MTDTKPMLSNYEIALRAEMKKVIRIFHRYGKEERIAMAGCATRANGNARRLADGGEYCYIHPEVKFCSFPTRKRAAIAGLEREEVTL